MNWRFGFPVAERKRYFETASPPQSIGILVDPAIVLPLLFAIMVSCSVLADEPAKELVKTVGKDAAPVVTTIVVLDAKPAEGEAKPESIEAPAEPLNLEILAAPLQALFGLGGGVNVMEVGIGVPQPADAVAQNDAMIQQFLQQFRPFLAEELGFVRVVCSDLSLQQRPKIKGAGEASLKQAAKDMADIQNRQNRGGLVMQAKATPEPRKMIREAIAKALQETLTREQMVRYKQEAADRAAHRKQAAILSVVSRLDGSLFLNPEQRKKIVDAITSNWQDKWEQWLMMSSYGDQYFPQLPDEYVAPHLNAEQKTVWKGLQKIDFGAWWGGGNQNQQNDGWWGDEPGNAGGPVNAGVIFNFQAIGF